VGAEEAALAGAVEAPVKYHSGVLSGLMLKRWSPPADRARWGV
jgi:hypothetical protein